MKHRDRQRVTAESCPRHALRRFTSVIAWNLPSNNDSVAEAVSVVSTAAQGHGFLTTNQRGRLLLQWKAPVDLARISARRQVATR